MNVSRPILITGRSLVSAAGTSLDETWTGIMAGRVMTENSRVPIDSVGDEPRVITLARRVGKAAINDAGWTDVFSGRATASDSGRFKPNTALVVGTSKGTIDAWLDVSANELLSGPHAIAQRPKIISRGVGGVAEALASEFAIAGPVLTTSAACASGLHALIRAAMLIRSGDADRALVVAAESSLHPLFLASFDRLGVLARRGEVCRPFDVNRRGFFVAEAAAAVCLEAENPTSTPRRQFPKLSAFGLAADATHLTGQDETGKVLGDLIHRVVAGRPIDFIHAHGTGTRLNDPAELAAIRFALGQNQPPIYSHKAALGHTLGAAGLLATVLSLESMRRECVPQNVATDQPIHSIIHGDPITCPIRRSLITVAGFGGATAAAVLENSQTTA